MSSPRELTTWPRCTDNHERCDAFAAAGECKRNPTWMLSTCALSCAVCGAEVRAQLAAMLSPVALHGEAARAVVGADHPLRDASALPRFLRERHSLTARALEALLKAMAALAAAKAPNAAEADGTDGRDL